MELRQARNITNALIVVFSIFVPIVVAHGGSGATTKKVGGGVGVVRVTAATHTPKVGDHWPYVVYATGAGKAGFAKLTAQIVDPIGRKHAVGCGTKKGNVTSTAFTGTFKDFIVWPLESVGYPLKLRITVVSGDAEQTVDYKFTVHK